MLNKIFPKQADNNYRGQPTIKWAVLLLTMKAIGAGLIHMFGARNLRLKIEMGGSKG